MSMGYVVNGKYVKKAGNASIENLPVATSTDPGLMSVDDKKVVDKAYTTDDVADEATINSLFNKN